jgi:Fe2+ or Zn2+ uptake regulation protein
MGKLGDDLHFVQVSLAADFAERLRTAGLRVTRSRIAVLYAVHTSPHSETEMIIRAVHDWLPDVSRQAVYDCVAALTSAGLLRRVQPSGLVARYESRVGDNHHHMVCRCCGAMADVDCALGAAPCLTASQANGFQLDEAEVIFWGLCPQCSPPNGSQAVDERPARAVVREERRVPTAPPPAPPRHSVPERTHATRPRPWAAPSAPASPVAPAVPAEVGANRVPANAVLISFDVAGAALTGYGRRKSDVLPGSGAAEAD